jgi:DNA-binding MarR family transcriptional regulator
MAPWTFLTNHAIVLFLLAKHPLITGRELSGLVGITERSVRNILSDLESEGYIKKSKEGRHVRFRVNLDLPLRHRTQQDKVTRVLLEALDPVQMRKRGKKYKSLC